ncbi:MAG: hypothetical protein ACPLXP_00165 [Microgenomates group bacterium]
MEEKEFYQWLEVLIYSLQLPEWPLEEKISREEAIVLIANFFNLDPTDPQFLQKAFLKLSEIEAREEVASIPPNLKELVAVYEEHLTTQEAQTKANPSYWEYYQAIFEEVLKKIKNPYLAKAVSQRVTQKAAEALPQVTHPQAFEETVPPEEYQKTIQPIIEEELAKVGINVPPQESEAIAKKTQSLAAKLAATPRPIPTPPPRPPISEEIPPSVTAKIAAEPQGVAFKPVFTLLHPPTAVSFAKKIVLTPIVKPLQWAVKIAPENISEEIKKAVLEGLTSRDIQASIKALKEAGLASAHPKINQLKTPQEKLEIFESSHKVLSFFLRHYHEFSKKTASRQIQEPQTGLWLPRLSPQPVWHKQKGYSWSLREGLNRLGVFLKTHQWIPTPSGKTISFVLPDKITRLITFGKIQSFAALKSAASKKIVQPVLIWLGKTAIGKAIKTGAKKVASWALAKLGISLAGAAVGAAAGPPGWVAALVSFLPTIVSWAKRGLKRLSEKPELAIFLGIGLIGMPILVPMLPALGFIFTAAGIISAGIGLLSKATSFIAGAAAKVGSFLSGAANAIGGFFSSLTTVSFPSALPMISVTGSIGVISTLSLLAIITSTGAFITSSKYIAPPEAQLIQIIKTANPLIPIVGGTEVNYRIVITSGVEKLTQVTIKDEVDTNHLENFSIAPPGRLNGNVISWPEFELNGIGNSIVFTYSARAKAGVTQETKITNVVIVSGKTPSGEIITRKASTTLNSDGGEIVLRALEIINSLSRGFWNYWNRSSLYPELFDEALYQQHPNHCVYRENYPPGCTGDFEETLNLFWCTWLVIKSYNETGHPIPAYISSQAMANWFQSQGKFLPANTNISQIQPGDVLFLIVPAVSEKTAHHVAIISEVTPDYIRTLDANSSETMHTYTVAEGKVQNLPGLAIYGFGKP